MASSNGPAARRGKMDFLASKMARLFFLTTAIQAIICLAFEAYVFGKFQTSVKADFDFTGKVQLNSQYKTIPTFLTLFIFGFVYQLVLVWDALRLKNTIQIIGIGVSNLAFLIYTALQIDQIGKAIDALNTAGALKPTDETGGDVWAQCRPFLIAIPCVISAATISMGFLSWKLYREFAWDILKQIGADYRMTKRFLHYQIYIALLKFDFFFFLGFTVQFLVIVTGQTNSEFVLTIAAIPVTVVILILAAIFIRREFRLGMAFVIALYFAALAYFFFKLVRIYEPGYEDHYEAVRRSLTAFAVLTIVLIICTIINAFICWRNFGAGLKDHLKGHLFRSSRHQDEEKSNDAYQMQDQKPQLPSRMTID